MIVEEQNEDRTPSPIWATPMLGVASFIAIASASCCVLPMGLTIAGLGGTWLTALGPFVAYRPFILVGVGLVLGVAWTLLFIRRSGCARRRKTTLAFATFCTVAFLIALSAPLWEQDVLRAMLSYWRRS